MVRGRVPVRMFSRKPRPRSTVVDQVLLEVEVIHVLVDETERVYLGRLHSHEWYYVYISVVKEAACTKFIEEPL